MSNDGIPGNLFHYNMISSYENIRNVESYNDSSRILILKLAVSIEFLQLDDSYHFEKAKVYQAMIKFRQELNEIDFRRSSLFFREHVPLFYECLNRMTQKREEIIRSVVQYLALQADREEKESEALQAFRLLVEQEEKEEESRIVQQVMDQSFMEDEKVMHPQDVVPVLRHFNAIKSKSSESFGFECSICITDHGKMC